jgi:hypothetical protein
VQGKWGRNALVFATKEEAERNAHDLMMRWFATDDSRAVESDEPVNYRYVGGRLYPITYIPEPDSKSDLHLKSKKET